MNPRTVLVLGGGVGGIVVATRLRRLLKRGDRVVVIERDPVHRFQPSFLWILSGQRRPADIERPLTRLRKKGVEVELGEIDSVDPERRVVRLNGRLLSGDAIVVALGAALAPEAIPGLARAGHNLYTEEGVGLLREAVERLDAGRVVVLTAAPAYKCPAAPYEAAMLIEYACRRQGVREAVDIAVYAAEPAPMGVAGPAVSAGVREMLAAKGIRYHPEHQVTRADPAARQLTFANGALAEFDLLAYVPPHRAPDIVVRAGLAPEGGWVNVDPRTLETSFPSVFAVGDVTSIPLAMGKPLPKAGVFAERQAEVVARNVAARFRDAPEDAAFDGWGACFVEVGDGRAAYGTGNFYAMPTPQVTLRRPSRVWHWGKVLFEKWWLARLR